MTPCHPASGDVEVGGCWRDDTGNHTFFPCSAGMVGAKPAPSPDFAAVCYSGQKALHLILLEAGLSGVMP